MSNFSAAIKNVKYMLRQSKDVAAFGRKTVVRENVSNEFLDTITPFKRISNKPTSLTDPKWFISKFEQETGSNFLPLNWATMSEAEKVDLIVHRRYSKLVSNKIMNKIKDNDVEHLYSLDKDGEIIGFSSGVSDGVGQSIIPGTRTTIHNHPNNWIPKSEIDAIGRPIAKESHSYGDVSSSVINNIDSYVVDWQGSKFLLEPAQKFGGTSWNRSQIGTKMGLWVDMAADTNNTIEQVNLKLQKSSTLEEFATTKFKEITGIFERQRAQIREFADKGWCKFSELT